MTLDAQKGLGRDILPFRNICWREGSSPVAA